MVETRVCSYCQQPNEPLRKQRRANYGKLICDPCEEQRFRASRRSPERRARDRAIANERYARAVAQIRTFKDRPCADCGGRFPHYVMDFDHPDPAVKLFSVANRTSKGLTPDVLAEIAKCDLVCSNCHRIRTQRQFEAGILKRPGRPRLPDWG